MALCECDRFHNLLQLCIERDASDLHISAGKRAALRCRNKLYQLDEFFAEDKVERLIKQIFAGSHRKLDLSYCFNTRRFRLNIYSCLNGWNIAVRLIRRQAVNIESFDRADVLKKIADMDAGLILICGAAGSGKSSTLASLIEHINHTRACHIITLEEPIEYVFCDKLSIIHQREFNEDFKQFSEAVKAAMRQDPDVLMVGEIRDLAAMKAILDAAETGHLVLGTLHASSASEALERIQSFFPSAQSKSVSVQIASCLRAVICQKLLTQKGDSGDDEGNIVCCMEILLASAAVKNLIRRGNIEQIATQMQLEKAQGMQTMQAAEHRLKERQRVD